MTPADRVHTAAIRRWLHDERPARLAVPAVVVVRRWMRRWTRRRGVADAALAALLAVAVTPQMVFHLREADPLRPWYLGLSVALIAPLALRRRAPLRVFAVVAAVGAVQWFVDVQLSADVAVLVALATVAAAYPWRGTLLAAVVAEVGAAAAAVRWQHGLRPSEMFVVLTVFVLAATATGAYIRSRRRVIAVLREQSRHVRRERDQRTRLAVADERQRIGRDVHDAVGHSLAVIVTLAAGNAGKASAHPERVDEAVALIEQTARVALADTRHVLSAVPGGAVTGDARNPAPGLADLHTLVDTAASTGLHATFVQQGPPDTVSTSVGLAVYRICQEALTNVLKHADATTVGVTVDVTSDHVVLTVVDDGAHRSGTPSAGSGLIGVEERARQVGGSARIGRLPTRGWRVAVSLPLVATGEDDRT